jgi:hypothetical protein
MASSEGKTKAKYTRSKETWGNSMGYVTRTCWTSDRGPLCAGRGFVKQVTKLSMVLTRVRGLWRTETCYAGLGRLDYESYGWERLAEIMKGTSIEN